jgi:putative exosortase-associated protein (TIGR04073 family)
MFKKLPLFVFLNLTLLIAPGAFAGPAQDDAAKGKNITAVQTQDMRYHRTPVRKLFRGFANLLTCPLEVPASIFNVSVEENNDFTGFFLGGFQGLFTSILRGTEGAFDAVTFIIPPYSKSIVTPEFAWDSLKQAYERYDSLQRY